MATVRAAAIYARISSDPTGQALGVARQVQDCRALAESKGWVVAEEYVDNDVSAYGSTRRPAYDRLLTDVAERHRDAVIVYNLDRLTRQPIQLERFLETCQAAGVADLATVTADINMGNDDGMFMARISAAFAAKESGRKSARVLRKMRANAEAGLPHGGSHRPFGFEDDRVTVREPEAVVIREVVARFLAGESLMSLTRWLQESEVPTVSGKEWRTPTIRAIVTAARTAGLRSHHDVVVGQAVWPEIITREQRRQVHALLAQKVTSGRRTPRRYLLSGLLTCGKCGYKLYSQARENTRRYVCSASPDHGGCGRLTVVALPVETLVAAGVLHRLDTPALADALAGRDAQDTRMHEITVAMASDQAQLAELADAYGNKLVTMREWLDARKPIEARIANAERQLTRSTHGNALAGLPGHGAELHATWDTLNLTRQAAIISAVLDHAVIAPGVSGARRLDPGRVQPVWRL